MIFFSNFNYKLAASNVNFVTRLLSLKGIAYRSRSRSLLLIFTSRWFLIPFFCDVPWVEMQAVEWPTWSSRGLNSLNFPCLYDTTIGVSNYQLIPFLKDSSPPKKDTVFLNFFLTISKTPPLMLRISVF
jgi:hypothetical protein